MREALAEAFEQAGGVEALTRWAKREPTAFYKLYARLIPRQIESLAPRQAVVVRIVRERANGTPRA